MGHLRVPMGHLRVTVGHPWVTIGHLKVTIVYFFLSANIRQTQLSFTKLVYIYIQRYIVFVQQH